MFINSINSSGPRLLYHPNKYHLESSMLSAGTCPGQRFGQWQVTKSIICRRPGFWWYIKRVTTVNWSLQQWIPSIKNYSATSANSSTKFTRWCRHIISCWRLIRWQFNACSCQLFWNQRFREQQNWFKRILHHIIPHKNSYLVIRSIFCEKKQILPHFTELIFSFSS
jgi:hypothetical protein